MTTDHLLMYAPLQDCTVLSRRHYLDDRWSVSCYHTGPPTHVVYGIIAHRSHAQSWQSHICKIPAVPALLPGPILVKAKCHDCWIPIDLD